MNRDARAFGAIAALLFAAGCSLRSSQATFSPQVRSGTAVRSLSTSGQYLYAAGLKLSNYGPDGLKPLHRWTTENMASVKRPRLASTRNAITFMKTAEVRAPR